MNAYDREDFNDTIAGLLSLHAGDALPWHVGGQMTMSHGAAKAVRDCTQLGLCSQQRRLVDGLIVFVAVRTAQPVLQHMEIAA
jgi:hypothetical protein